MTPVLAVTLILLSVETFKTFSDGGRLSDVIDLLLVLCLIAAEAVS